VSIAEFPFATNVMRTPYSTSIPCFLFVVKELQRRFDARVVEQPVGPWLITLRESLYRRQSTEYLNKPGSAARGDT